ENALPLLSALGRDAVVANHSRRVQDPAQPTVPLLALVDEAAHACLVLYVRLPVLHRGSRVAQLLEPALAVSVERATAAQSDAAVAALRRDRFGHEPAEGAGSAGDEVEPGGLPGRRGFRLGCGHGLPGCAVQRSAVRAE